MKEAAEKEEQLKLSRKK